jgi:hypothetical protein
MSSNLSEVHESTSFSKLVVDKKEGIIRNIKILGPVSKNGRRYSDKAMREGFHKYENAVVNRNHDRENPVDRDVNDRLGQIINVRYVVGEGIYGDFQLLLSDPISSKVMETAEKMPHTMGFSHYAICKWKSVGGVQEAQEIDKVISVDLVGAPATTEAMHESMSHVVGECAKCKKMSSLSSNKDMEYGDKLKAVAEEYGITDNESGSDTDDKSSSKEEKGSASESFSFVDPVHKESAMAEPVVEQTVAAPVAESTVVAQKVETPAPAPAVAESSNSLSEIEHLCDVAGVKLEKAVMESLGAVPRSSAVALIKKMALAESVEKPVTGSVGAPSQPYKIDFAALRS